jgi:hypothetical protein
MVDKILRKVAKKTNIMLQACFNIYFSYYSFQKIKIGKNPNFEINILSLGIKLSHGTSFKETPHLCTIKKHDEMYMSCGFCFPIIKQFFQKNEDLYTRIYTCGLHYLTVKCQLVMNIKITIKGLAIVATLFTTNLFGQADTTKKADAPLTISGEVDAYFRGTGNKINGAKTSYTSQQGGFGLGMANVVFAKDNGKIGFVADLMFGQRGDETNYSYTGTATLVKQLYITYKPTDKLKFTAGNFMTYFGYELVEASNNLNYSMSYNYTNGPFFHTGLKADIAFTDKFSGMIGVFNQTDSKGYYGLKTGYEYLDTHKKMVGGQLSYISGPFKIYFNGLVGQGGDSASLTTLDVTTSYQATEKFGVGFNFTAKNSTKEKTKNAWNGSALYLNYAFSPKFVLAARGELFNDKNGWVYSASDNAITAFTLSGNIKIDAFTIIPEIRFDSAKKAIWSDGKKAKDSEVAFILAAVYKF